MTQLVVSVDPCGAGTVCGVIRAPIVLANPHLLEPVELGDLDAINGPEAIRDLGERLAERIRANVNVGLVLDHALAIPAQAGSLPICFRIGDSMAHALSWEALVGNNAFFALDQRWPIARIARGGMQEPRQIQQSFSGSLRFVAVLSAVQTSAVKEWEGLCRAVEQARMRGLAVDVTVFAGEEEIIEAVRALPADQATAMPVPGTAQELLDRLRSLEPHLLHLYCHGSIESELGLLSIGTVTDFDRDDGRSSVGLRVDELGQEMADAGTWAIVLNACEGAAAGEGTLTHAEAIVNAGVPVAVGMRRLVDAADARAFSAAFYAEALKAIAEAVAVPAGQSTTLEWAGTLVRARRVLRDNHGPNPAHHDAWTLPVLYTREGAFQLTVADAVDAAAVTHSVAESETLGGIVDVLADSAPPGLLEDLRELTPPSP